VPDRGVVSPVDVVELGFLDPVTTQRRTGIETRPKALAPFQKLRKRRTPLRGSFPGRVLL